MNKTLKKAIKIIVRVSNPEKIILFGSQAINKNNPDSDYDLLVLANKKINSRKLSQKIYMNFEHMGAPIDIIIANVKKYELLKEDPYLIYSNAAKNGKIIYEKSENNKRMAKKSKKQFVAS